MIIKEQNNHNKSHCAYDCVCVCVSHTEIYVICMPRITIRRTSKRERKEMLSIVKCSKIFIMIYKYRETWSKQAEPLKTTNKCICVQNLTVKLQWVIIANLLKIFDFERNFHLKWPEPIKIT